MKRFLVLMLLPSLLCACGKSDARVSSAPGTEIQAERSGSTAVGPSADDATLLMKSADDAIQAGDANGAVRLLSQAIAANPRCVEAYVKRGAILAEAKLFARAIADMTSAISFEPDNSKFLNTRGYFLLLSQQYDRADSDFSDAIGLDLQYPQPYNNRGLVWIAREQYMEAVKDFDNALRIKPDYVDAHNNRGFALLQQGKLDEAIGAFTRALELDPKYMNSLTNRGRAYLKLGQADHAVADLTRAIELQPDNPQLYVLRSEAYRASGQDQAAFRDSEHVAWTQTLAELNRRIAQNPNDANLWARRGQLLLMEDRREEAQKSFQNALALLPEHPQALIGQARLHMQAEEYALAVADCTRAVASGGSYEAFSLRGDAHFRLGQYTQCLSDYEAARRFDEQVVRAYRQRAEQLRAKRELSQAQADEQMADLLEQRLTEAAAPLPKASPRAMVIEQASYEEAAPAPREIIGK